MPLPQLQRADVLSALPRGADDQLVYLNEWFIRLRWVACGVAIVLSVITISVLHYLGSARLAPLLGLVACLAAANLVFTEFLKRGWFVKYLREMQIGVDLVVLTAMLHESGGIENPLSFAYLFHIIIGGILFDRGKCYVIVVVASGLFGLMALAEMAEWVDHYTLLIFPHVATRGHVLHAAHDPVYVASVILLQAAFMTLTAYFTTNIMGRLRTEERQALTDRQRLERVLQATEAGLLILDTDLRPVWLNDQIRAWLDLPQNVTDAPPQRLERWIGGEAGPAAKTRDDGAVRVVERQTTDSQGNIRFFQITIAPLIDSKGCVYQVAELAQDITVRKATDAEMVHAGKMAMLGLMAAGIAHEVGNPLASISTRLHLLEEEHDEAFLKKSLELLRGQIARISRTVHGVSQFAKPADQEWTVCQVNTVVGEVLNVLRLHRLAKRCEIHSELAEVLPETLEMRDQLMHVFLNLGLNALEAMPAGGTLTVRTRAAGQSILVTFTDTGEGMSEEVRSQIFSPLFSTKKNGMGIGLSIVHNIAQLHGGRINVESTPGRGATFTVRLPIRTPPTSSRGRTEEQKA